MEDARGLYTGEDHERLMKEEESITKVLSRVHKLELQIFLDD